MDIEYQTSQLAYWYCFKVKDVSEIYKYIIDPYWANCYCLVVKDRPEVRKYIKE